MADARRTWRLQFGLGAAGLSAALLAVTVAVTRIEFAVPSVGQLLDACRRWTIADVDAQSVLLLALGSIGLAVMALTLRSFSAQARAGRRFARRLEGLPGLPGVANGFVVNDDQPHAFCFGLLRPRVFVSRGAIEFLDRQELDAVIAHELHHARRRDPLRLLVARGLAEGLFFMPVLRHLVDRCAAVAELDADGAAVRATGGPQALASALLALESHPGPLAVGIAPERVDRLLGHRSGWELPVLMVVGAIAASATLFTFTVRLAESTSHASVALPALVVELCMLAMAALPLALGATALLAGRAMQRRGLG